MGDTQNDGENRAEVGHSEEQQAAKSIDTSANPRKLDKTLGNINTNMVKMATVLERIYERQCSMDGSPGNEHNRSLLPPANSSRSNVNTRSLSGESSRQNNDDQECDRVSIYASGDEQDRQDDLDADLEQLTEQNHEINDQPDSELLQDLANELEEDEPTGPSINQSLADIANKRWGKQLGPDKVKALLAKYKRPENCGNIAEIRVNAEIWNQLSAQKKKTDLQLSNIQQTTRKLLFANLQMTSVLMEAGKQTDTKSLLAQAVDSVALLGHMSHNLSQLRRDQIRPALKSDYASICSSSAEHTDSRYLFGDDLPKRLRDAKESCRIGSTMTHSVRQHSRKPYARENYNNSQRPFNNRSQYRKQGKDFFLEGSEPTRQEEEYANGRQKMMQMLEDVKNSVCNKLVIYLPDYIAYLEHRCQVFVAGQVANHFHTWVTITSDKEILSDIVGMKIQCDEIPYQHRVSKTLRTRQEHSLIDEEITKLINKKVIAHVEPQPDQILSGIFLHPKKDGSFRLILNLKQFNTFVTHHHFKMDSLSTITKLVVKDCFMASIDLKDAYYSIPIHSSCRKYLRFEWNGKTFEYTCLPNGLSCCPRKFTKILKPLLAYLHRLGNISVGHIDDLYLQGSTYEQCVNNVVDTVVLLDKAGFVVHPTKSSLIPSQEIVVLGFTINSITMIVKLTVEKASQLQHDCLVILKRHKTSIREAAKIIGKIVSSFPGVMYGPLHYRHLEHDKTLALKQNNGDFEADMIFSPKARQELEWWVHNVLISYKPLSHGKPTLTLTTDASKLGWGAMCDGVSSGGNWTHEEAQYHINYLEMLAIFLGLQTFAKNSSKIHIRIMTDNTTAISVLNNMGTSHSDACNELGHTIWEWCILREIYLTVAQIPGRQNLVADFESRRNQTASEWKLDTVSLHSALKLLQFEPDIDLFASRINHQYSKYVSYRPDPNAIAIDAFSMDWSTLNFYAFPPFSVILPMLHKIQMDKARGVCVVPDWPTQGWYPLMMQMQEREPVRLKAKGGLLYLPSHPMEQHPLHQKLHLLVVLLSGKD